MGNTGFFVVSWSLVTFGNTNFLDAFHLQTTVWLLWQPKWMQPCLWSFLKGLNGRFTTDKGGFRTDKETLRNTSMDNFQMTPSLLQPVRLSWLSNYYSQSSLCVNSVEWMNVVFKYFIARMMLFHRSDQNNSQIFFFSLSINLLSAVFIIFLGTINRETK